MGNFDTGNLQFHRSNSRSGQALIEYILLLSIILSITGLIVAGVKTTRDKMWKQMICDISAACETCRSTESAQRALPRSGDCKY